MFRKLFNTILVIIFLANFTVFSGTPHHHTLAPLSYQIKPVFIQILEDNIAKLNNLRNSSEYISESVYLTSVLKPYFKGKIEFNTLKQLEDGRIELTLIDDKNSKKETVVLIFESDGKFIKSDRVGGDLLYKINLLAKIIESLKNSDDDFSLDEYVFLSDLHGAYYRVLDFLLFKLKLNKDNYKDASGNINYERVENAIIKSGIGKGLKLIVNGDLPDRAPDTLKTFRFVKRLDDAGLVRIFINGNHDFMAQINMMGLHLPFYDNFKGIPKKAKSYIKRLPKKYDDSNAKKVKIRFEQGEADLYEVDLNEFLVAKKEEDQIYESKEWWARKYRDFIKTANRNQTTRWSNLKNEFKALFDVIEDFKEEKIASFIKDEKRDVFLRKWWGDLMGFTYEARVDVYTGARAVEMMPLSWWDDKIKILDEQIFFYYKENGVIKDPTKQQALVEMRKKLMYVRNKLLQEVVRQAIDGDWTSTIIGQGINILNYESIEWYAADWIFHGAEKKEQELLKGGAWGPSAVYERILDVINEHGVEKPWRDGEFDYFDIYTISSKEGKRIELPNCVNYVSDSQFEAFNTFLRADFKAYSKDLYGNTYMHAFPPIVEYLDPAGNSHFKASFEYKGETYEDETFFEGLDKLEADIKDLSKSYAEIREAFSLYMSWFADATITCKPQHMLKYKQYGFNKILDAIGVNIMFVGHNPLSKLGGVGIGINTEGRLFNADNDMSPKYKNMGLIMSIGVNPGILVSGSEQKGKSDIVDFPKILNDKGESYQGTNQNGLTKNEFSKAIISDLQKKLNDLKKKYLANDVTEIFISDNHVQTAA